MEDDLFAIERIGKHLKVCLSALPVKTVEGADVPTLGSPRGYFIYEVDERPIVGGTRILAKAASLDAAYRLMEIWSSTRGVMANTPSTAAKSNEPARHVQP